MSNSSLVDYVKISPNRTSPRRDSIKKITIHHMAGNLSVETCGNVFAPASRQASSNYGIDSKGRVGLYVEEKDRSWCSANGANDHQAVTIEVADDKIGNGWHSSDAAMNKLVELCTDICERNGIKQLNYTGDTSGNLTMHKWFVSTDCPGAFLESKFPWIASEVNKRLSATTVKKPTQSPGNTANNEGLWYRAHVADVGTLDAVHDGQTAGTTGYAKAIQGIWIDTRLLKQKYKNVNLNAKAHIQGTGWVSYKDVQHDTLIGTTGQNKRLEAIELDLQGLPAGKKLLYRTHLAGTGWTVWIEGGFSSGSVGLEKGIEAIQLKIV